jgi:hypothetical protein
MKRRSFQGFDHDLIVEFIDRRILIDVHARILLCRGRIIHRVDNH